MSPVKYKISSSNNKSTQRSMAASTGKKIQRDLKLDFDDYVLRQEQEDQADQEHNDDQKQQQNQQYEQRQQQEAAEQIGQKIIQQKNTKKSRQSNQSALKKSLYNGIQNLRISNQKININKMLSKNTNRNNSQNSATIQIPNSYLLAMQHLQDLLKIKDETIFQLKQQLIEKQHIILQSQQKINQILVKYNQMNNMCNFKENQVVILKQQIQQLRIDKNYAIKQAAKIIEPQFKPYPQSLIYPVDFVSANSFKHRSMSTGGFKPYLNQQAMATIAQSKQYEADLIYPPKQSSIMQRSRRSQAETTSKVRQNLATKLFNDKIGLDSHSHLISNSYRKSQTKQDRDYVSYQRQVLRNQKQLIALKYRMQCLQRKLLADPKQQSVKGKIRKLSQQIEQKQKSLNNLKRV